MPLTDIRMNMHAEGESSKRIARNSLASLQGNRIVERHVPCHANSHYMVHYTPYWASSQAGCWKNLVIARKSPLIISHSGAQPRFFKQTEYPC